jgi:hypothetical protein
VPETGEEAVTVFGYDPRARSPYWIRYRDAIGREVVDRFDDPPWEAGSDYEEFVAIFGAQANVR